MVETADDLYDRDRVIAGVQKLRFFPLAVSSGKGCWLFEKEGRKLLDLSATWAACGLGHGHPEICAAVKLAISRSPGGGGLSAVHPDSVGLAEDLLAVTPGAGERRVYIGHSGSDANNVAIHAAMQASGRKKIVAFEHGYHGGLGVAMEASGVHLDAGAVEPSDDIAFASYPNVYRAPSESAACASSLESVETLLAANDVACVLVEPILSDGGLVPPPRGFLSSLAHLCAKYQTLLICDEVKVGLGRSGLLHAFEHDGITPDLITFGKSLGAGLPLSAVVGPADLLDTPVASALLTTSGNPVSTAAGRAILKVLAQEDLPGRAATAGRNFQDKLRESTRGNECVGDIRGRGLAIGVEIVRDRESKERAPDLAAKVVYRLWELGAVAYYVGSNVIEITPPLIISDEEVSLAVEMLSEAVHDAATGKVKAERLKEFAGWGG